MSPRLPAPACSQAPLGAPCCCCKFCELGGCDIRVMTCGCCLHVRCCPVVENQPFAECPICQATATSLQLMPMHFDELDHAKKQATLTAVSDKRGKKRKNATLARLGALHPLPEIQEEQQLLLPPTANLATYYLSGTTNNTVTSSAGGSSAADSNTVTAVEESADSRTGRWTQEETDYCDSLIEFFEQGKLPIPEGLKLNEFLANMLKSKQARLTKKMKNAKLAARQYKRVEGYIASREEARAFSRLETEFFASIKCPMERSEIRFHMQKEWRDLFSSYCIAIGQSLDANAWLSSVEELDQRTSLQKDAARMVRRKVLLGHALSLDTSNSHSRGVYIKAAVPTSSQQPEGASTSTSTTSSMSNLPASAAVSQTSLTADPWERRNQDTTTSEKQLHRRELLQELAKQDHNPMKFYASPFIEKVTKLMKRLSIPFEHVDAWVPSFVSTDSEGAGNTTEQQVCRLCFAGCATVDDRILPEGGPPVPLTPNMKFDLLSFGEYSEKFSFDIGCGLPGRVYSSGVASWEQGIQNAPLAQFERSGGASQWGIQTVVGIPIPSPTAGRIVIVFYSTFDRSRNLTLVNRISEALTKLRPSPKWKLVVDVGVGPPPKSAEVTEMENRLRHELLDLIHKCTPADKSSPLAPYLPGFTSLRLLLTQQDCSHRDNELLKSVVASYESYTKGDRPETEIAAMTARDFMLLSKQFVATSTNSYVQIPAQDANATICMAPLSQQQQQYQQRQQQQQQQSLLYQMVDPDPVMAPTLTGLSGATGFGAMNCDARNNYAPSLQPLTGQQDNGNNNARSGFASLQHMFTGSQVHGQEYPLGFSPALHPIPTSRHLLPSPMNINQEQLPSLGVSPALHPITSQADGVSGLGLFGLSASQISALLQNDARNFQGL